MATFVLENNTKMIKRILSLLIVICSFKAQGQIQTLQKLGQLSFNTTCAGVWHYVDPSGNEYALLGNGDGLVIVDVNDPTNPTVLHTVPAASSLWREVKTFGHYAYAGTEGGGGITIVDLSGLPATYISKTYTGDGAIAGQLSSSHTVQVFGNYLYAFGTNIGTVICDLTDPWNPVYVGSYGAFYVHDGTVRNDTLWSSEVFNGQFSVVDVTDKSNPAVISSHPTPGLFNHNGWFSDDGRYFYTTDEQNNTPLGVFDVSDMNNITLVNTFYNDSLSNKEVHNVRVFNDYLINPSYGSQLTIVDAARPLNLVEIARHPTGGFLCWDASPYLPSGNIIATDMDGEFYVFAPFYQRACYLEGNVTNSGTGSPILNVNAVILGTSANDSTDILGDYRTGYPTSGTFNVEFSASGFASKTINNVALTNGNVTVLDVMLDPLVGLNENMVNPVRITPNPTADWIQISVDGFPGGSSADVFVYDAKGLLVHRAKMNPGGNYSINMSAWPAGIYSVLINGDRFNLSPTRVIKY